jgi:hypothetical protein
MPVVTRSQTKMNRDRNNAMYNTQVIHIDKMKHQLECLKQCRDQVPEYKLHKWKLKCRLYHAKIYKYIIKNNNAAFTDVAKKSKTAGKGIKYMYKLIKYRIFIYATTESTIKLINALVNKIKEIQYQCLTEKFDDTAELRKLHFWMDKANSYCIKNLEQNK